MQLSYNPMGELIEVRDPQGRRLRFIYAKSPSGLTSALSMVVGLELGWR